MPTYEYMCDSCKKQQEIVQKASDKPLTVCPICHKESLRRLVAKSVSLQFKGSGFYINDYAKQNDKPPACDKGGCGCK